MSCSAAFINASRRGLSNHRPRLGAAFAAAAIAGCGVIGTASATPACKLQKTLELPITMFGMQPTIPVKIEDSEAAFLLDSGAFYSTMSGAVAAQHHLKISSAPYGLQINGIGGVVWPTVATVKSFSFAGVTVANIQFLVGGSEAGRADGILGQNLLEKFDVEYDLSGGVIRLFKASDCRSAMLAYWVKPGESYSTLDITKATPLAPHTRGGAFINGTKVSVIFDTGAATSMVFKKAAVRAGMMNGSVKVTDAGYTHGLGRGSIKSYIAPVANFKLGDEEIRNTRLRIGDSDWNFGDMLIGADFFLSHRVFVSNSQARLYFTYNGGPVFNLEAAAAVAAQAEPFAQAPAADHAALQPEAQPQADPAALARQGAALAARRDFAGALLQLTRACDLAPDDPEYFFQRANVYWQSNQSDAALADFDRAIAMKADFLPALEGRARLRLQRHEEAAAGADLDAADRAAAAQADIRLALGRMYEQIDRLDAAVAQFDLWIKSHPDDARKLSALGNRCWSKAMMGTQLDSALSDCDSAYRGLGRSDAGLAYVLSSRALVRLRLGNYTQAIADDDAALKVDANLAVALYSRGVAEIRIARTAQGQADIAAATRILPHMVETFMKHGVVP